MIKMGHLFTASPVTTPVQPASTPSPVLLVRMAVSGPQQLEASVPVLLPTTTITVSVPLAFHVPITAINVVESAQIARNV